MSQISCAVRPSWCSRNAGPWDLDVQVWPWVISKALQLQISHVSMDQSPPGLPPQGICENQMELGIFQTFNRGSLSHHLLQALGHQGSGCPGPGGLKSSRTGGLLLVPVQSLLAEPSLAIPFPFLDHACHFIPVHLKYYIDHIYFLLIYSYIP